MEVHHIKVLLGWTKKKPSVEVPVGDFFAAASEYRQISSLAVCVLNPGSAFNSYWIMPFKYLPALLTYGGKSSGQFQFY